MGYRECSSAPPPHTAQRGSPEPVTERSRGRRRAGNPHARGSPEALPRGAGMAAGLHAPPRPVYILGQAAGGRADVASCRGAGPGREPGAGLSAAAGAVQAASPGPWDPSRPAHPGRLRPQLRALRHRVARAPGVSLGRGPGPGNAEPGLRAHGPALPDPLFRPRPSAAPPIPARGRHAAHGRGAGRGSGV